MIMVTKHAVMQAHKPGTYPGWSCSRKTREPAIPPVFRKKECVSVRLMISQNHIFLLGWRRGVRFSLPIPPNPTRLALQNARFHCPRILFAWKDMTMTTFACTGAQKRNTPKYRTPLVVVQPMRESPMMATTALKRI